MILKADWCGETHQGNVCVGSFLKFQKTPGLKPEIRVFGGLFLEFSLNKFKLFNLPLRKYSGLGVKLNKNPIRAAWGNISCRDTNTRSSAPFPPIPTLERPKSPNTSIQHIR